MMVHPRSESEFVAVAWVVLVDPWVMESIHVNLC